MPDQMPPPPDLGPGGVVLDPAMRFTPDQLNAFYWARHPAGRVPEVGEAVDYRHRSGEQLVRVTLDRVRMDDRTDPNVYEPITGRIRRDPAPVVEFFYIPAGVRVACREARVPDSAGWSWPEGGAAQ